MAERYKVLEDGVELTSQAKLSKGIVFKWDTGSEVTTINGSQEEIDELISSGKLELIEE